MCNAIGVITNSPNNMKDNGLFFAGQKMFLFALATMCLCNILQAEVKVNLAALKQDCESLKPKIVQSPKRFKGVSAIRWTCVLRPLDYFYGTDFDIVFVQTKIPGILLNCP